MVIKYLKEKNIDFFQNMVLRNHLKLGRLNKYNLKKLETQKKD